jgi:hypothetical protein
MDIACYSKTLILIHTLHINLHPHLSIGQRDNILEIWQTTNSQWLQTPLESLQCYSLLYTTMFLSTVTSESNQTNVPWPFDHWLHIHRLGINWSMPLSIFVLQSHFTFEENALFQCFRWIHYENLVNWSRQERIRDIFQMKNMNNGNTVRICWSWCTLNIKTDGVS